METKFYMKKKPLKNVKTMQTKVIHPLFPIAPFSFNHLSI